MQSMLYKKGKGGPFHSYLSWKASLTFSLLLLLFMFPPLSFCHHSGRISNKLRKLSLMSSCSVDPVQCNGYLKRSYYENVHVHINNKLGHMLPNFCTISKKCECCALPLFSDFIHFQSGPSFLVHDSCLSLSVPLSHTYVHSLVLFCEVGCPLQSYFVTFVVLFYYIMES